MPDPEISIVIPTYNNSATIRECLEAIRDSEAAAEVIIVDDCSSDNTLEICREFTSKIIENEKNHGQSYSRNLGARQALAAIVVFLDSDIIIRKDTIKKIMDAFNKDPTIDVLQGRFSEDSYYRDLFSQYKNLNLAFREIVRDDGDSAFINTSLTAVKKEVLQKYSFDEQVIRAEDSLLGWQLYKDGYRIVLDKSITGVHKKKFNIFSFTKYQFKSGCDLLYNWKNKGMGPAVMSPKNALHNKLRILRAPVSGLIFINILLAIILRKRYFWTAAEILFVLSIILQHRFLVFLIIQKRFIMFMFSLLIFLYDGFVSGLGVFWGVITGRKYMSKKNSQMELH